MSNALAGAMTGATIGSAIGTPGIGTAIGAGIGAGAGLLADLGLWFMQDKSNKRAEDQNYKLAQQMRSDTLAQNKINNEFNQQQLALARDRFGWEQGVTRRNQNRDDRLDSYGMRKDQRDYALQQFNNNTALKQNLLNAFNQRAQIGRA